MTTKQTLSTLMGRTAKWRPRNPYAGFEQDVARCPDGTDIVLKLYPEGKSIVYLERGGKRCSNFRWITLKDLPPFVRFPKKGELSYYLFIEGRRR